MKKYKIAVAGTGYVGLSIATLLSQHHHVTAVDILPEKVALINARKSPIRDDYIEKYLAEKELDLTATLDAKAAYADADFVVIAAPTNYDSQTQHFDTSAVEAVIRLVTEVNPNAVMVIKSTIPVGYTVSVRERLGSRNILFSPEFLRESKALYDNLYPSRIIVGTDPEDAHLVAAAHEFAALLQEGAIKENIDTLFMGFTEAEAVKLFANTYLALRVSFFNGKDIAINVFANGFAVFFDIFRRDFQGFGDVFAGRALFIHQIAVGEMGGFRIRFAAEVVIIGPNLIHIGFVLGIILFSGTFECKRR